MENQTDIDKKMAEYLNKNEKISDDCSLVVLLQANQMPSSQIQLIEAARKNDLTELQKLIENRVNVNAKNNLDRTALHWAAANGNSDVIDILARAAANVNAPDKYGNTPLLLAAWYGHVSALEVLTKNKKIVIPCFNRQGMDVLHCAAANDHVNVLEFLKMNNLFSKLDINKKDVRGKTALLSAAEKGYSEMFDYLLTIGCDSSLVDLTGRTAIHYAASSGHSDIVGSLLRSKANVQRADGEGMTPLHLAAEAGHVNIVRQLVSSGADINAETHKKMTALLLSSAGGHLETASVLLDNALCNRNHQDEDENTALHLASANNNVNVIRLLVVKGCNVRLANKVKQTALHLAAEKGHSAVVLILLSYGSDVKRKDNTGKTPLALAARANFVAIVDMIIKHERLEMMLSENQSISDVTNYVMARQITSLAEKSRVVKHSPSKDCNAEIEEEEGGRNNRPDEDVTAIRSAEVNKLLDADIIVEDESPKEEQEDDVDGVHHPVVYSNRAFILEDSAEFQEDSSSTAAQIIGTVAESSGRDVPVPDSDDFLADGSDQKTSQHASNATLQQSVSQSVIRSSSSGDSIGTDDVFQAPNADSAVAGGTGIDETSQPVEMRKHKSVRSQERARSPSATSLSDIIVRNTMNDYTSPMKVVLWKLASKKLKPGEWKKLARYWQFTEDQIRAIDRQYTGEKSSRDHTYRMLLIWLDCYLEAAPPPSSNPLRGLYDGLVGINKQKLAEEIRNKCNQQKKASKSCVLS